MKGAAIDAVVLGMATGNDGFEPEVWITADPVPSSEQLLTLAELALAAVVLGKG